jgi:hypothetical protein
MCDIIEAKLTQDLSGHSSRLDVLSLNFNEQKLAPIHDGQEKISKADFSERVIEDLEVERNIIEQKLDSFLGDDTSRSERSRDDR